MTTIDTQEFTATLRILLDETFENAQSRYLDQGTSLFETLAAISAEEASIPVGGKCATLAAQVKHVAFFLDFIVDSVQNPDLPPADWGEIWRTVGEVTPQEWQIYQDELRASYERILALIDWTPDWSAPQMGGAIGVVAHSAYHLGEIRQALCVIKS